MKFTIKRDSLFDALQKTHSVINKKTTMDILTNILCTVKGRELFLDATDLEVGIKITLPVENAEEGKLAISAKHFLEIVRELPNENIDVIRKENNWVEILCKKSKFNLVGLIAEEYPNLPSFNEQGALEANTEVLKEMIDYTSFATSLDSSKVNFNGIFFEHLGNSVMRMTGCDGTRLSFYEQEVFLRAPDIKRGVIIPSRGLGEFRKFLDESPSSVPFHFERGHVFSQIGKTSLFIRLIDGEYPDYRQVIPKVTDQVLRVNHESLFSALKRVSLFSNEKSRSIKFSIQGDNLTVFSSNPEMGEAKEDLEVQYTGEPMDIGFNSRYLLDYLSIIKAEVLEIHLKDRISPGIIRGVGKPNHTYVIMPMRVS